MEIGWPREPFLIRHAESAGNVARDLALANGAMVIDIDCRDCDGRRAEKRDDARRRAATSGSGDVLAGIVVG